MNNLCHPDVGTNPDLQAAETWLNSQVSRVRATGKFAEFVTITPAMAQVMLMHNPSNRAIVANAVRRFATEIKAGLWRENGEPIIIADTGELNDGQHRLTGVVETGIPIYSLVVFGTTRTSRQTIDTGTKKTAGHILGMLGTKNAALTAAALKQIINLQSGMHVNTHRESIEIEAAFAANPSIMEGFGVPMAAARSLKLSQGMFVALHYLMAKRSAAKAAAFFEMLHTGLGLIDRDHPVSRLRSRLLTNLGSKAKLPPMEVVAITIKAWNAFADGRTVDTLRWRKVGDAPEAFPQVYT